MWYEKRNEDYFLINGDNPKIKVKKDIFPGKSKAWNTERDKALVYMKAINEWDGTAFGAGMSCMICDAVVKYNGELKLLVFSTVNAAERSVFKIFDRNFKRKCLRRVDEFYSRREYQEKIKFPNENIYNDHILRPIVFIVSTAGVIEEIPRHKDLLKYEIKLINNAFHAVDIHGDGTFDLECSIRLFNQQNNVHEDDYDRWGTTLGTTYSIK